MRLSIFTVLLGTWSLLSPVICWSSQTCSLQKDIRETSYLEGGLAVDHPAVSNYSEVRYAEIGQHIEFKVFDVKEGIGAWTDTSIYGGVKNAFYLTLMGG